MPASAGMTLPLLSVLRSVEVRVVMARAVVEAVPETDRVVEVALVVVPFTTCRLVMVEVALLTRIPPEKVSSVEVALDGNG